MFEEKVQIANQRKIIMKYNKARSKRVQGIEQRVKNYNIMR